MQNTQATGIQWCGFGCAAKWLWNSICQAEQVKASGAEKGAVTAIPQAFSQGRDQADIGCAEAARWLGITQQGEKGMHLLFKTQHACQPEQSSLLHFIHLHHDMMTGPLYRVGSGVR